MFLPRSRSHPNHPRDAPRTDSPDNGSPSLPDSSTAQTLAFGIAATLLALFAIYLSYRQLQAMRNRHKLQATSSTNDTHGDAELVQLRGPTPRHSGGRHYNPDFEPPFVSARVLTFQHVTIQPWREPMPQRRPDPWAVP
ncbi:hypothetical protein B0T16DRAFT_71084 [Cercophora newfieldiana]|uniref:Uncharacterized protein n=1 Tax=Cercophora newfieldiana TaxID=92897 RepID=A0AA40D2N0_9PEZI|nr:hypothetical protein B0T16DRAFT_71084 [Cercophora newfieldiana]